MTNKTQFFTAYDRLVSAVSHQPRFVKTRPPDPPSETQPPHQELQDEDCEVTEPDPDSATHYDPDHLEFDNQDRVGAGIDPDGRDPFQKGPFPSHEDPVDYEKEMRLAADASPSIPDEVRARMDQDRAKAEQAMTDDRDEGPDTPGIVTITTNDVVIVEYEPAKHYIALAPSMHRTGHLQILRALLDANGQVVSRPVLARLIWGPDATIAQTKGGLSRVIRTLRDRIESDPSNPQHLLTVLHGGYRLRVVDPGRAGDRAKAEQAMADDHGDGPLGKTLELEKLAEKAPMTTLERLELKWQRLDDDGWIRWSEQSPPEDLLVIEIQIRDAPYEPRTIERGNVPWSQATHPLVVWRPLAEDRSANLCEACGADIYFGDDGGEPDPFTVGLGRPGTRHLFPVNSAQVPICLECLNDPDTYQ